MAKTRIKLCRSKLNVRRKKRSKVLRSAQTEASPNSSHDQQESIQPICSPSRSPVKCSALINASPNCSYDQQANLQQLRSPLRSPAKRLALNEAFPSSCDVQAICSPLRSPVIRLSPNEVSPNRSDVQQCSWGNDEDVESIMQHELCIELEDDKSILSGYRIVDIKYTLQKAMRLQIIHNKKCTGGMLTFFKEKRLGLFSTFIFKCNICDGEEIIESEDPHKNSFLNTATVWGTLATGSTFAHTEEFLSVIEVPPINRSLFFKIQRDLGSKWKDCLFEEMEAAANEERALAAERGDVDENGVASITVLLDGGWSKRSYGHSYDAASGVGVIIGKQTGKLLFLGVRNKYCTICTRAANRIENPKEHLCFKNWTGSSSAMEPDIIVEGFNRSIDMYKLKYTKFVADGDSTVFSKIKQNVEYGAQVTKIECTNHAIKNYTKHLYKIKNDTKTIDLRARKLLTKDKILELSRMAQRAIYTNAGGDINKLKEDIQLSVHHVYGNHECCKDYFCNKAGEMSANATKLLYESGAHHHIFGALNLMLTKTEMLIDNETTNRAELFMSILARFNLGKRVNFCGRDSFAIRAYLSGLKYNLGHSWHKTPYQKCFMQSPGNILCKYMERQDNMRQNKLENEGINPRKRQIQKNCDRVVDYGSNIAEVYISEDQLQEEINKLIQRLKVTQEDIKVIEEHTRGQYDNARYITEKMNRLTASFFGAVVKRKATTSCDGLVKQILNQNFTQTSAMEYGKINETVAISKFCEKYKKKVRSSGLFINDAYCFLGASPDGIINEDEIVEVKCLHKVACSGVNLLQAVQQKAVSCLEYKDNKISLKKNHNYYYQIQGQLATTKAKCCYLIIYSGEKNDLLVQKIYYDEHFYDAVMLPKLIQFYTECLAPELILNHRGKQLKCRDPPFILQAKEAALLKNDDTFSSILRTIWLFLENNNLHDTAACFSSEIAKLNNINIENVPPRTVILRPAEYQNLVSATSSDDNVIIYISGKTDLLNIEIADSCNCALKIPDENNVCVGCAKKINYNSRFYQQNAEKNDSPIYMSPNKNENDIMDEKNVSNGQNVNYDKTYAQELEQIVEVASKLEISEDQTNMKLEKEAIERDLSQCAPKCANKCERKIYAKSAPPSMPSNNNKLPDTKSLPTSPLKTFCSKPFKKSAISENKQVVNEMSAEDTALLLIAEANSRIQENDANESLTKSPGSDVKPAKEYPPPGPLQGFSSVPASPTSKFSSTKENRHTSARVSAVNSARTSTLKQPTISPIRKTVKASLEKMNNGSRASVRFLPNDKSDKSPKAVSPERTDTSPLKADNIHKVLQDIVEVATASKNYMVEEISSPINASSNTVDISFELDYDTLKKELLGGELALRMKLLQALRWRLTKSDAKYRDYNLVRFVTHDVLHISILGAAFIDTYLCPSDLSTPHKIQDEMARFLNTMASLAVGREYLSGTPSVMQLLLMVLMHRFEGFSTSTCTREQLLATVQKLSLSSKVREIIISMGTVKWLVNFIKINHKNMSSYEAEYSVALFTNLSIHNETRLICERMSSIIEFLQILLNTPFQCCLPYLPSILGSLLLRPIINQKAMDLQLEKDMRKVVDTTANTGLKKQMEAIILIHSTGDVADCSCSIKDDPSTYIDFLEAELNANETIYDEITGEALLTLYKATDRPTENQVHVIRRSCVCPSKFESAIQRPPPNPQHVQNNCESRLSQFKEDIGDTLYPETDTVIDVDKVENLELKAPRATKPLSKFMHHSTCTSPSIEKVECGDKSAQTSKGRLNEILGEPQLVPSPESCPSVIIPCRLNYFYYDRNLPHLDNAIPICIPVSPIVNGKYSCDCYENIRTSVDKDKLMGGRRSSNVIFGPLALSDSACSNGVPKIENVEAFKSRPKINRTP